MLRSSSLVLQAERAHSRRPGELYRIRRFGITGGEGGVTRSCSSWVEDDEKQQPRKEEERGKEEESEDKAVSDVEVNVADVTKEVEVDEVLAGDEPPGHDEVDDTTSGGTPPERKDLNEEDADDMKKWRRKESMEMVRERERAKEVVLVEGEEARRKEEAEAERRRREEASWPKVKTFTAGKEVITTIEFEPTVSKKEEEEEEEEEKRGKQKREGKARSKKDAPVSSTVNDAPFLTDSAKVRRPRKAAPEPPKTPPPPPPPRPTRQDNGRRADSHDSALEPPGGASRPSSSLARNPPPPTHSRLPPDGHEFPPDYRDPASGLTGKGQRLSSKSPCAVGSAEKKSSGMADNASLNGHDEHSIKSVRDKIAFFSVLNSNFSNGFGSAGICNSSRSGEKNLNNGTPESKGVKTGMKAGRQEERQWQSKRKLSGTGQEEEDEGRSTACRFLQRKDRPATGASRTGSNPMAPVMKRARSSFCAAGTADVTPMDVGGGGGGGGVGTVEAEAVNSVLQRRRSPKNNSESLQVSRLVFYLPEQKEEEEDDTEWDNPLQRRDHRCTSVPCCVGQPLVVRARGQSLDSAADAAAGEEPPSTPLTHPCRSLSGSLFSVYPSRDRHGSVSSLASSTSLISPQELQSLIEDANQSLEESGTPSHEILVVVLHREFAAGSVGIALAGGADYECTDVTVHKVIPGTLAARDGRVRRGDRVLSINGRSTKGVAHRDAIAVLKAPRPEVVLVLSRSRSATPTPSGEGERDAAEAAANSPGYVNAVTRPPRILESPLDSKSLVQSDSKFFLDVPRGPPTTVVLRKEGTGLGFSLEGGRDSPAGDRPLTVKKVFAGGAAEKAAGGAGGARALRAGDEVLSVDGADCARMTRMEAWNFLKRLPEGHEATIVVRQALINYN